MKKTAVEAYLEGLIKRMEGKSSQSAEFARKLYAMGARKALAYCEGIRGTADADRLTMGQFQQVINVCACGHFDRYGDFGIFEPDITPVVYEDLRRAGLL